MADHNLEDGFGAAAAGLLEGLVPDGAMRQSLLRYGRLKTIRHGRALCCQGEPADRVWLLLQGRLNRYKYRSDDSLAPLPWLVPGDWCGLAESLSGSPYLAEVLSEDSCLVLGFSLPNFRLFSVSCQEIMGKLIPEKLAREIVAIHSQLADAGPLDRILSCLLGRRRFIAGIANRNIGISQAEIARLAGCTRETVNKYLRILAGQGLVKVGRRNLEIPDWEALARFK